MTGDQWGRDQASSKRLNVSCARQVGLPRGCEPDSRAAAVSWGWVQRRRRLADFAAVAGSTVPGISSGVPRVFAGLVDPCARAAQPPKSGEVDLHIVRKGESARGGHPLSHAAQLYRTD